MAAFRILLPLFQRRTAAARFVAVIADQNHRGLGIHILEQRMQHHVVKPITTTHDFLI